MAPRTSATPSPRCPNKLRRTLTWALHWHLHELIPDWEPATRRLDRLSAYYKTDQHLDGCKGLVTRLARALILRLRQLIIEINALTDELTTMLEQLTPTLPAVADCGPLTAAKLNRSDRQRRPIQKPRRLRPLQRHRPLPVWSSNHERHRLSRVDNRQLNAALHRIALAQADRHPPAKAVSSDCCNGVWIFEDVVHAWFAVDLARARAD